MINIDYSLIFLFAGGSFSSSESSNESSFFIYAEYNWAEDYLTPISP